MTTLPQQLSDSFRRENERFGIITGTFAFSQFPNVPCKLARLKGMSSSTGSICMGDMRYTGTSVVSLPWHIGADYDTGWFATENLNLYAQKGSSGTAYLAYWVQG